MPTRRLRLLAVLHGAYFLVGGLVLLLLGLAFSIVPLFGLAVAALGLLFLVKAVTMPFNPTLIFRPYYWRKEWVEAWDAEP